jgi:hypothetical protein
MLQPDPRIRTGKSPINRGFLSIAFILPSFDFPDQFF